MQLHDEVTSLRCFGSRVSLSSLTGLNRESVHERSSHGSAARALFPMQQQDFGC